MSNTKNSKKQFIVSPTPQTSLYGIRLEGGGQVPKALEGMFTSKHVAAQAIQVHNDQTGSERSIAE